MTLPSLNGMRAFEAAARLGSIKDAAAELHLTPSAVSRHIRALEESLGQNLFDRGFRQITLTYRGTFYARHLTEAFSAIARATEDMRIRRDRKHDAARRVRVLYGPWIMSLWLADRLPGFRRENPEVDLEVLTGGRRDRFDLVIFDEFTDQTGPVDTLLVPILETPVCAPSLLEGPIPLRTPADLLRHNLIHECETGRWLGWLAREGVTGAPERAGVILDDCALIMREAMNGFGIALADTLMAEDLLRKGQLVAPFAARHPYPGGIYLSLGRNIGNRRDVGLFRDWLMAEVARHRRAMRID
ncbi:MAG: LysR family transcriptional regulator [Rhodobacteraceae bacterium]|nr:LysR family transcriptional regulator [Paracoccaceae bacterium]